MNLKKITSIVIVGVLVFSFFYSKWKKSDLAIPENKHNPHFVIATYPRGFFQKERGKYLVKYLMYDTVTATLSDLPKDHPYFSKKEEDEPRINNDYLKQLLGLRPEASAFQKTYLEDGNGSYIVESFSKGVTSYWSFNPITNEYKLLYSGKNLICDGDLIDWDTQMSMVLVLENKQSLVDSSSDDVSGICVYDYSKKQQVYNVPITLTRNESYTTGWGGLRFGKVVLSGGNRILVIDIYNSKKNVIPDVNILSLSEVTVKNGLLMLIKNRSDLEKVEIYDLEKEEYITSIKIEKNTFGDKSADFLQFRKVKNVPEEIFILEYIGYAPYEGCWYTFNFSGISEKLLCTNEIYQQFFKGEDYDRFRAELVGYYD